MATTGIKRLFLTRGNITSSLSVCSSWSSPATTTTPVFYCQRNMSSDTSNDVILDRVGNKGIITLNRPNALNALSLPMIHKIYPQLRKWEMDNSMKVVIIKGAGDKAFCAGGDVKAIAQQGVGNSFGPEFFRAEYRLNNQIGSLSIPYIALLNGITMGGGVGLSVHGAFRVATEKAVFAMPETAIGFFPDVGGSHFLPRLPGKLGLFLALTGHRLEGRDLFKAGVATHFIASERLDALEADLMRMENPEMPSIHRLLSKYQEQWEKDHYKEFSLKPFIGRINSIFGGNTVEEIMNSLKRDSSEWAKQQYERLSGFSPTSLKVTFRQIKEGSELSLADCLRMEFRMSHRFMQQHDFFEGVRAALIDKDKIAKWKPATLEEVTDAEVDEYFKPLSREQELQL